MCSPILPSVALAEDACASSTDKSAGEGSRAGVTHSCFEAPEIRIRKGLGNIRHPKNELAWGHAFPSIHDGGGFSNPQISRVCIPNPVTPISSSYRHSRIPLRYRLIKNSARSAWMPSSMPRLWTLRMGIPSLEATPS